MRSHLAIAGIFGYSAGGASGHARLCKRRDKAILHNMKSFAEKLTTDAVASDQVDGRDFFLAKRRSGHQFFGVVRHSPFSVASPFLRIFK
jgi:hypothetical protein